MKLFFLLFLCGCVSSAAIAQSRHANKTLYPSFKGLIMSGYQGWFRAKEDGSGAKGDSFGNDMRTGLDMWPDVSEYKKTYETPFLDDDGKNARFFSSYDKSTVALHFEWMKQYGLDGVFMQRFFEHTRPENRGNASVKILKYALDAASDNERAIAVMYDLSGLKNKGEDCSYIIEDWKYLVDSLNVTNQKGSKTYLADGGKPVVAIWGVGFPDRPYNIRNIGLEKLIDFLQNDSQYGNCKVMLGVPTGWRTLSADCTPDPYLHVLIEQADMVLPWTVQRYTPLLHNEMDRLRDNTIADLKWCREHNTQYIPCAYPGFSWHNLSTYEFPDDIKPFASIPRQKGNFYWNQMTTLMNAGVNSLYIAMFDEVNEGTAIFKVADKPPHGTRTKFLGLEGLPSDHYLWLTGLAGKMLKHEIPFTLSIPKR